MSRAEEIIDLRNRELTAQANIRSLWQETADKLYPYVQITATYAAGVPRTTEIYDQTPMLDGEDMVSGLKQILIPSGQTFFAVKAGDGKITNAAQRYTSMVTEVAHEELFKSNFITEFDEVLRSLIYFGPASIYSEWTPRTELNYRTCVVGSYQFLENSKKLVDGIILTIKYTPRQAVEEFGKDKVGKEVLEALNDPKKQNDLFEFIYLVRPRGIVNPNLSQNYNGNMPFESVVVNVKEKIEVAVSGYPDFPYHSARWKRPAYEKHGRGIGTEILPQIKVLDRMARDFIDVGNKWANPPRQVHESVEGPINAIPGGNTYVREMDTVRALDSGMLGNFPITEKILDRQQEIIHRAFYKNAFSPLEDLTGDRRTTLEIRERIKQTWHRIGPPVARVWYELLEKCITRSVLLLIRNGVIPYPLAELQGVNFGIEFVGPFALELRSQQAKAFQEWASWIGEMEATFPDSIERPSDHIDIKDAIPRMGRTFGVNAEDMASEEERRAKLEARQQKLAAEQALQLAQMASQAYPGTTKAPESGSPAEALMGAG